METIRRNPAPLPPGADTRGLWLRRAASAAALAFVVGGATGVAVSAAVAVYGRSTARLASPPARPPERPAPRLRTVRIVASGDITLGTGASLPPGGPDSLLAGVRRVLRAGDVVLGNLETTLTAGGSSKCGRGAPGCFAFRAPESYAAGLRRVGFTVLNIANNHAWDYGESGQADTVAALDRAGLRHTGRPGELARQDVRGIRVAILGFAAYPWAADLRDLAGVRRAVAAAEREVDVVVVTMHAGAEGEGAEHVRAGTETYLGESRGDVVAFARAAVDAGADLVAGHGPHVVRGLEWYRGRLIAYSLGNLSGHHTLSTAGSLGIAALLDVTLDAKGRWQRGRLVPLRLVDAGRPLVDTSRAAVALAGSLSRSDFAQRGAVLAPTGDIRLAARGL